MTIILVCCVAKLISPDVLLCYFVMRWDAQLRNVVSRRVIYLYIKIIWV